MCQLESPGGRIPSPKAVVRGAAIRLAKVVVIGAAVVGALALFDALGAEKEQTSAVSEKFVSVIIKIESAGNPKAVSRCGARGLMQVMKPTWKDMTKEPWSKAFDPELNVQVGTKYLRWIESWLRKQGQEPTAESIAACYNGGIGRFKKAGWDVSKMPAETRAYVVKVSKLMKGD